MFISSKELKSFMKENHLPDFEDLPKPLEETDDGLFMLPMDSMDIRDALPFDDVSWDKAKEGVKWNSTGITRDEENKKWVYDEWQVWTSESIAPCKEQADREKPSAATLSVSGDCILGLFAAAKKVFVTEKPGEENFQVERMFVYRDKEEPIDILLLHTPLFYAYPSEVGYKALLFTRVQSAERTDVTYIRFPAYRGTAYIREHLRGIVMKKTNVWFETESVEQDSWLVFPYLSDRNAHSELVPSMWTIASDIWAPAYVSFQTPIFQESDAALSEETILIRAPRNHVKVAFMLEGNQELQAEFYYGESYRYGHDYIDCDYAMEPERYALTGFAAPDGYSVKEFFRKEEINTRVDTLSTFAAMGDAGMLNYDDNYKMIKLIPPYIYQVNCKEIPEINRDYGFLPVHKNEYIWEPGYKSYSLEKAGWKLSELKDIHVIGLFREKDLTNKLRYYILSATGRWYCWDDFLKMEDDDFGISGLTEDAAVLAYFNLKPEEGDENISTAGRFIRALTGYVLGVPEERETTICSFAVHMLKQVAKAQGMRIRTLHGESHLSMMNNMPAIWKLLEGCEEFAQYKV